jgi:hypothetical protein
MAWQSITMFGVVALVGFPASFKWLGIHPWVGVRNVTALVLIIAWLAGEIWVRKTGDNLPFTFYTVTDMFVMFVICGKATAREGCSTYPTMRYQARRFWAAITPCDRIIIGLFLLGAWPIYVSGLHSYYKWNILCAISIAQFMLAGLEALFGWRRVRRQESASPPDNILHFAPAYARKLIGAEPIPTCSDTLLPLVGNGGDG